MSDCCATVKTEDTRPEGLMEFFTSPVTVLTASCCDPNPSLKVKEESVLKNVRAACEAVGIDAAAIHLETLTHAQTVLPKVAGHLDERQGALVKRLMATFLNEGLSAFPMVFIGGDLAFHGDVPEAANIERRLREHGLTNGTSAHQAGTNGTHETTAVPDVLYFKVKGLDVTIKEGVKLIWQGREIESGPLTITLGAPGSCGIINYRKAKVLVEFRTRIVFNELAEVLGDFGADPELTAPIEAIVRSRGSVFDDHSLRLAGRAEILDHKLFTPAETIISIRAPSQCRPDLVSQSRDQIQMALCTGRAVSWGFNPTERRVDLTLPKALGGTSHVLCIAGSYTLTIDPDPKPLQWMLDELAKEDDVAELPRSALQDGESCPIERRY
jgi:hypothetical protein